MKGQICTPITDQRLFHIMEKIMLKPVILNVGDSAFLASDVLFQRGAEVTQYLILFF